MIENLIANKVEKSASGVWHLAGQPVAGHAKGSRTQAYLEKALSQCSDLSTGSAELGNYIKDAETEYFLSGLRSTILRIFDLRSDASVLEIGCECGAITRFLGENCKQVTGIESDPANARLARLRTRDLHGVEIISAPLSEIQFSDRFDVVVIVNPTGNTGLSHTTDIMPDNTVWKLAELITPDGLLILAADSPTGLAWAAATDISLDAIIDEKVTTPSNPNQATMHPAATWLALLENHFDKTRLYFPYPDHRLARCILSREMLEQVPTGELLDGICAERIMPGDCQPVKHALIMSEIEQQGELERLANAYVITASNNQQTDTQQDRLGIALSANRTRNLRAITYFHAGDVTSTVKVVKKALHAEAAHANGSLTLVESESEWVAGTSLQRELLQRACRPGQGIEDIFIPARIWLSTLRSVAHGEANQPILDGTFIDHIWKNAFIVEDKCTFIDEEWQWNAGISLSTLLIRSIFLFLQDAVSICETPASLRTSSTKAVIRKIAETLGMSLTQGDFDDFCRLEAEFQALVFGRPYIQNLLELKLLLHSRSAFTWAGRMSHLFSAKQHA